MCNTIRMATKEKIDLKLLIKKTVPGMFSKSKETLFSVLPIVLIVLILYFTPAVDLTGEELLTFCVSAICLILGIALFNLGAELAMTPMGEYVGVGLTKAKKLPLLLGVAFLMGLLITIAEPDLSVLAGQVSSVMNGTVLIVAVGVGVGLFLLFAIVKIVFKVDLAMMVMFFYLMLFAICAILIENGNGAFLPLTFDSGGVTTGPVTVPFIMALGVGVAYTIGGRNASENSFGLIALCSIGPMIAVAVLALTANGELTYTLDDYSIYANLGSNFGPMLGGVALEVLKALGLIVAFFIVLQLTILKLPKRKIINIAVGIIYTFIGLVVFLSAVKVGFVSIGFKIGTQIAAYSKALLIVMGVIIGFVTVLAEPAVRILNKQVEEVTDGLVTKKSMMIALSIGVGVSIGLSMIRLVYQFSILYYIIPGYIISLALSFFVPKMYTAIAFDSGGVASGPLTSSFILPLAIGACTELVGVDGILSYAFGVVAMVAMTPLITIQFLGFRAMAAMKVREDIAIKRIIDKDDEQIIDFM